MESCWIRARSVESTTPSPFRSGFARPYQKPRVAGEVLENNTPDGWKSTRKLDGSMVRVTKMESPPFRAAPFAPATSPFLGMAKHGNRPARHALGQRRLDRGTRSDCVGARGREQREGDGSFHAHR